MRDRPGVVWLALAVLAVLFHRFLPGSRWLMVHLVVLGAVTHSITVWSNYFAVALLKPGPARSETREQQQRRLILLNAGIAVVVLGVPTGWWPVAAAGGVLIVAELAWHITVLVRMARGALPSRFAIAVRYYILASLFFPVGITLGVLLAHGLADPSYEHVLVAHTMTNLLGWVGLSVEGTLLTLWPTVLRSRMDDRAANRARAALPVLVGAVLVVIVSALLGFRPGAAAGIGVYVIGLVVGWRSMVAAVRRTPPRTFAATSLALGQVWLAAGLIVLAVNVLTHGWVWVGANYTHITLMLVVGFVLQTLLGAMTHLIPAVLGGGPKVYKAGAQHLERWGIARAVVLNGCLFIALLPVPSLVLVLISVLGLASLVTFIPLMFKAIHAAVAARKAIASEGRMPPTAPIDDRTRPIAGQLLAGLVALALALSLGTALSGPTSSVDAAAGVPATGRTTTVKVTARDMKFTPSRIEVPAGNRLVLDVTNTDPSQVHDLVLANGASSGRLSPGGHARVDAGVIGRNLDGWCSVIGHRQMGMTLTIIAAGAPSASSATGSATGSGESSSTTTAPSYDLARTPGAGFRAWDPALPAVASGTTHRVTFTVEETRHEIAPGVTQTRWTYYGGLASPVLHGRIGDTFVVTLVNKGTMGHSIDFHAGTLAPDKPMRTIAPGQSLVYTFRATRSGIWMYHCSTAPMSTHISAGMAGAVIIDPPGLPAVDKSYVFVQSEIYAGANGSVDPAMVATEAPNFVVFNGYAGQYDHTQPTAKVGERVRIWVLDAGPNKASSFHVVGGQFDTVYKEGAYLLKNGKDAFGDSGGGAQALDLQPAQGGFVELTFPEAGHYPFVSHAMSDAEKGAHGVFDITP